MTELATQVANPNVQWKDFITAQIIRDTADQRLDEMCYSEYARNNVKCLEYRSTQAVMWSVTNGPKNVGKMVQGAQNAAQKLPSLQWKNLWEINQTLRNAWFSLKNPWNNRNQNRCHPDGSVCRVNPIWHPPKRTDPHLHKESSLKDPIKYDDYGNIIGDYKSPEVHIPINP